MKLKFKSTGSTTEFVAWLKGFKDINTSLLLEVDPETSEFVAKTFPDDRTVVKYSKLSFEQAGFELTEILDNDGQLFDWSTKDTTDSNRVMVSIFSILSKFIDVENTFAETEHDMTIDFDICNSVTYIKASKAVKEYQATAICLSSLSLKMVVKCGILSEHYAKCDDETFLTRVCNISNPSSFSVSSDAIVNLAKISSLLYSGDTRERIQLYSKEENGHLALYAQDYSHGAYEYLLGYFSEGAEEKTSILVFKKNFLNATKGLEDQDLKLTLDTAGASRVLVESGDTKVIIAAVADESK